MTEHDLIGKSEDVGPYRNRRPKMHFFGAPGSYTELAGRGYARGLNAEFLPSPTVSEIIEKVRNNGDVGVVPIENTNGGAVLMTLQDLAAAVEASSVPLYITGEVNMKIRHMLMSRGSLEDIKVIYTHVQASMQCALNLNELFRELGRQIPVVTVDPEDPEGKRPLSTSEAAKIASLDTSVAAIAGEEAALEYKVPILRRNIQDNPNNATRFLVLGNRPAEYNPNSFHKTSLILYLADAPGSLHKMLRVLADKGINLSILKSYKEVAKNSGYGEPGFFISLEGHVAEDQVVEAIVGLQSLENVSRLYLLGSYRRAEPLPTEVGFEEDAALVVATERYRKEKEDDEGVHLLFTLDHKLGALERAIKVYADEGVNLWEVDSWPTGVLDRWGFYVSFDPGEKPELIEELILQMSAHCKRLIRIQKGDSISVK